MINGNRSLREKAGALIFDMPRYLWTSRPDWLFCPAGMPWMMNRNRDESLICNERRLGVRCQWQWTSDLHVAKVFPRLGLDLMRRALRDWPIVLNSSPDTEPAGRIGVSFIIGHRGQSRVSHLMATLSTIAAQVDAAFECIVVEQSNEPEVESLLPAWVRYVHTPLPRFDMPYSRAWTFNVGAGLARGSLLVMHDNDMLVPRDYTAQLVAREREGYEVINIKRFIFYLDKAHSETIMTACVLSLDNPPEAIVQNLEAGGSFAITRDAFFAIGGFDESFVGWGGEDNEFWERAQTRNVWAYGYMPLIHLWHEAQPDKILGENAPAKRKYWELSTVPPSERIRILVQNQTAQTCSLQK